jgi:hypothetical protein
MAILPARKQNIMPGLQRLWMYFVSAERVAADCVVLLDRAQRFLSHATGKNVAALAKSMPTSHVAVNWLHIGHCVCVQACVSQSNGSCISTRGLFQKIGARVTLH